MRRRFSAICLTGLALLALTTSLWASSFAQPKVIGASARPPAVGLHAQQPATKCSIPRCRRSLELNAVQTEPLTDLRSGQRNLTIVTTAAMPWMTGTAINPLLRAAAIGRRKQHEVLLVLPWLTDVRDQEYIFPDGVRFSSPEQQERWIRDWLKDEAGGFTAEDAQSFAISWYPAKYSTMLRSVFQRGSQVDLTSAAVVPDDFADIVILEEPEHLSWYNHGGKWSDRFAHVIGVVHTNYQTYAERDDQRDPVVSYLQPKFNRFSNDLVYHYSDINIKLSGSVPETPRSVTVNVHGVRQRFLDIGIARSEAVKTATADDPALSTPRPYFLAKALWTKGYKELLDLYDMAAESGISLPSMDAFGSGGEEAAIRERGARSGHPVRFHGGIDHGSPDLDKYNIFVNPSTSEVLCTATLEAIAMGKACVLVDHPSNNFFKRFKNVFVFQHGDLRGFADAIGQAQALVRSGSLVLDDEDIAALGWDAAVDRLFEAAALPHGVARGTSQPEAIHSTSLHQFLTSEPFGDIIRDATGLGAETPWSARPWHPAAWVAAWGAFVASCVALTNRNDAGLFDEAGPQSGRAQRHRPRGSVATNARPVARRNSGSPTALRAHASDQAAARGVEVLGASSMDF